MPTNRAQFCKKHIVMAIHSAEQVASQPRVTCEGGEVENEVVHTSWESSRTGYGTPSSSPAALGHREQKDDVNIPTM